MRPKHISTAAALALLSVQALVVPGVLAQASATPSNQDRSSSLEDQVRSRVTEFYSAWRSEGASTIWDLLSDEQKSYMDREVRIANMKHYFEGLKLVDFKITMVDTRTEKRAIVSANLLVQSLSDGQKSEATELTNWVFQANDQRWHYAGVAIGKTPAATAAAMLLPTSARTRR